MTDCVRHCLRCLCCLLMLAAIAEPARSQWIKYPTAGVLKTPSGTPNLGAPTPRTADGKPDLSGMWEAENRRLLRPCPEPRGCGDLAVDEQYVDMGVTIPGGLPYQPWAAEISKARWAANSKDDPEAHCQPVGAIRLHVLPLMRKIVQVPGLIAILSEDKVTYRQIFTDGRPLPEEPNPTWNGYSSGKWEGDTLLVQTIGFKDGTWLDRHGSPLTEAAKVTERFRRVNYGNMEIEVTVDDPKAYTKPWTVTFRQYAVIDTELLDDFCTEGEKSAAHLVGK
jgi:hypothetical protein